MPLIDRISTPSQHLQSMDSLAAAQNRMAQLQEQVSSGKAFQRASEDPNGAQSAMKLRAEAHADTEERDVVRKGTHRIERIHARSCARLEREHPAPLPAKDSIRHRTIRM